MFLAAGVFAYLLASQTSGMGEGSVIQGESWAISASAGEWNLADRSNRATVIISCPRAAGTKTFGYVRLILQDPASTSPKSLSFYSDRNTKLQSLPLRQEFPGHAGTFVWKADSASAFFNVLSSVSALTQSGGMKVEGPGIIVKQAATNSIETIDIFRKRCNSPASA